MQAGQPALQTQKKTGATVHLVHPQLVALLVQQKAHVGRARVSGEREATASGVLMLPAHFEIAVLSHDQRMGMVWLIQSQKAAA